MFPLLIGNSLRIIVNQFSQKRFIHLALKCSGCGAKFQKEFKNEPGYLPPLQPRRIASPEEIKSIEESKEPLSPAEIKLLLQKDKPIICKRCHSFKSGKERSRALKNNRIQFADLKARSDGLVVLVVDLVDVPGTLMHDITDYVGVKDMIVILNKAVGLC